MFAFSQNELEARKLVRAFFLQSKLAKVITRYSLERFLSDCGAKISEGFLKFCKLMSNLF